MDIREQVSIMKAELRLANRSSGIANWTPEGRAKSLAVRKAKGSVWGWDKRKRGTDESISPGFDRTMQAIEEDAPSVRRRLAAEASGTPSIGPRNKYADEMKAQQLEAFKAWLAEVNRVSGAIEDFNAAVATAGGVSKGTLGGGSRRGKPIGSVTTDKAPAVKPIEKSIRRQFEKNGGSYARDPEGRDAMMDMVAEKAEYYSARPAQKVEMEKNMYRQIRDNGSMTMRETPAADPGAAFKVKLAQKRAFTAERDTVKAQLKDGESARPVGNGMWIGRDAFGNERVISGIGEEGVLPFKLKLKDPGKASAKAKAPANNDFEDMMEDARFLIGGRYYDRVANRWTAAARAASLAARKAKGSVWGWDKRKRATAKTESGTTVPSEGDSKDARAVVADEAQKQLEDTIQEEKAGYWDVLTEKIEDAVASYKEKGIEGMSESEKKRLADVLSESGELPENLKELLKELQGESKKEGEEKNAKPVEESGNSEGEAQFDNIVSGFKKMIEKGSTPTSENLKKQLAKDGDEAKYKLAVDALGEAWNAHSLDMFGDKYARDPKNNAEFRAFQKKIGVPTEFIGGK